VENANKERSAYRRIILDLLREVVGESLDLSGFARATQTYKNKRRLGLILALKMRACMNHWNCG